jgi:hypothetical protein
MRMLSYAHALGATVGSRTKDLLQRNCLTASVVL